MSTILDVRDLSVRYSDAFAVRDVSFDIDTPSCVALIGPNGAGKSSLLAALAGDASVLPFVSGSVEFHGRDISRLRADRRAQHGIARTYQVARPFGTMSVQENLAVSRFAHRPMSFSWLRSFRPSQDESAVNFASTDLPASARPGSLSQGDVKLLELAMAVGPQPSLLLLDEATAGMARTETRATIELLHKLREQQPMMTIVLVEHDMDLVFGVADRVIVLHRGEIVADGSPAMVQADDTVRSVYLGPGYVAVSKGDSVD